MNFNFKILFIFISFCFHAISSNPGTCDQLYSPDGESKQDLYSSPFIPLSTFIASEKDPFIVRQWAEKRKLKSIGPGIGIMYRTANQAAEKVLKSLKISPDELYIFDRPSGRIFDDFYDRTIAVMKTRKYKYIQNALILLPEHGVYTILPLAEYSKELDTYIPVVIKGHQDLKKSDILTAAVVSYAIGPELSQMAPTAKVALRPVVEKRKAQAVNLSEHTIFVENEKVKIDKIHDNFAKEYHRYVTELAQKKSKFLQENPDLPKEAFNDEVLVKMLQESPNSNTQVAYAPKKEQLEVLAQHGYPNKEALAKLDINSDEFARLSLLSGITPFKLRYLVGRSISFVEKRIFLVENIEDPGKELTTALHYDIEGAYEPEIKSGAYYHGLAFQPQHRIGVELKPFNPLDKNSDKMFIGGFRHFTQDNVDLAIADFLRVLKTDQRLKDGDYLITTYSPYEAVKFRQHLDIVKDKPDNFTAAQNKSTIIIKGVEYPLYWERVVYKSSAGFLSRDEKPIEMGYLIKRTDFFEVYPDLSPTDYQNYFDKIIDLLPIFRRMFAVPTKSNGLKSLLPYVQKYLKRVQEDIYAYGSGDNGLNCIAWYYHYLKTGDKTYLERIRVYLELDIDANRVFWDMIRTIAYDSVDSRLLWTHTNLVHLEKLKRPFTRLKTFQSLEKKQEALETLFDQKIINMDREDIVTLAEILDRSSYLKTRKGISLNRRMNKKRIKAILDHKKNSFESNRKKIFLEFAKSINPELSIENLTSKYRDALYELFSMPSGQITQSALNKILLKSQLEMDIEAQTIELGLEELSKNFETKKLIELINKEELKDFTKTMKRAHYKLLRFNYLEDAQAGEPIKEYGFDETFDEYEPVNMKEIWEGLLLKKLLSRE